MSKLSQKTQQAIANRAATYADQQHANDGDDIHIGYLDGATEWAGRAEEHLIPALEWIKTYGPCDALTIKFIDKAIGKYKEVENG